MKKVVLSLVLLTVLFGFVFAQNADSSGSGFFITNNGIVVTCSHVIEGATRIVILIDNREYPAQVLSDSPETDLAVLKINYSNPFHFKLTDWNKVVLGDHLRILGFPLGGILTSDIRFTEGSLSAMTGLAQSGDVEYFQHSAQTHPGNSGGPIFNDAWEIVGVAAAVIGDEVVKETVGVNPQNINFGIRCDLILPLLNGVTPGSGNVRSVPDAQKATVKILCYNWVEGNTSIAVMNRTGQQVTGLYVSPSSSTNWGRNWLEGNATISNGQSFALRNLPVSDDNTYDLRLVDTNGESYVKWNVVLSTGQNVEFTANNLNSENENNGEDAGTTTVTVTNRTGYTAWYLYISPTSAETWGPDRLESDVLSNGDSITLRNMPDSSNNRYDMRLVNGDGDSYTKWNVQVSANQPVVFTIDDFGEGAPDNDGEDEPYTPPDTGSGSFNGPPVTIVNNTGFPIVNVYISPTSSDSWGRGRLAANQVLSNGQSISLNLPQAISVTNKYDIMLEDSDGDSYSKYNVTVTANGRIVFTFDDFD